MTTESQLIAMLRKDFHFHSLFHHYNQQALQWDMRFFVQCDSVINSELFIDEWFWWRNKFVFLQQWWAWRTILCKYNSETFRINWYTHDYAEYRQHTENAKTLLCKK